MNLTWLVIPGATVLAVAVLMAVAALRLRSRPLRRGAARVAASSFVLIAFGAVGAIHDEQSAVLAGILVAALAVSTGLYLAVRRAHARKGAASRQPQPR
jgi:hypothetical protein